MVSEFKKNKDRFADNQLVEIKSDNKNLKNLFFSSKKRVLEEKGPEDKSNSSKPVGTMNMIYKIKIIDMDRIMKGGRIKTLRMFKVCLIETKNNFEIKKKSNNFCFLLKLNSRSVNLKAQVIEASVLKELRTNSSIPQFFHQDFAL